MKLSLLEAGECNPNSVRESEKGRRRGGKRGKEIANKFHYSMAAKEKVYRYIIFGFDTFRLF